VKVEEGDRCVKGTHVHAGVERESQAVETIQKHSRTSFAQRWPERTRWHTMVGTPMCGVLTGRWKRRWEQIILLFWLTPSLSLLSCCSNKRGMLRGWPRVR
jgi:hypothetical protein